MHKATPPGLTVYCASCPPTVVGWVGEGGLAIVHWQAALHTTVCTPVQACPMLLCMHPAQTLCVSGGVYGVICC